MDRDSILYWIGKSLGNKIIVRLEAIHVHNTQSSCKEKKEAFSQYYIKARKGVYKEEEKLEALKFMEEYLNNGACPDLNPIAASMLQMDINGIDPNKDTLFGGENGEKYIIPYD